MTSKNTVDIGGFYLQIDASFDDNKEDGQSFLRDIREILKKFGSDDTYSFEFEYPNIELNSVFLHEMIKQLGSALATVILVVFLITFNMKVTVFIVFVVLLVVVYMTAMIHLWGMTLFHLSGINLIFGLGITVDFSVHIAHKYLTIDPPKHLKTREEKRNYKASNAISQMANAVFHGGVSTFIAVCIIGFGKSFIFEVFFRCWFGMIIFGVLNGMILQPIILSMFGPINDPTVYEQTDVRVEISKVSKLNYENKSKI